jgi:type IV pilus assembly protein PilW
LSVAQDSNHLVLTASLSPDVATIFSDSIGKAIPYFLENCRSSDVFVGTITGTDLKATGNLTPNVYLDPAVTTCGAGGCPWDFRISNAFLNAPSGGITPVGTGFSASSKQLNAELHRAEFTMVYVATSPTTGQPALYVRQFERGANALADPEEMAEGIEAFKLLYGVDTDGDGQVDKYQSAADLAAGATGTALDAKWAQVLSVRIGMLLRSPEVAGGNKPAGGYTVLGTAITTTPNDGHLRQVYETTIAVRNRVFTS